MRKLFRLAVVGTLSLFGSLALGSSPASAIGPYYKTIGDTGIRCTNVGAQVYQSTYSLSSSAMVSVTVAKYELAREVNGTATGTYKITYRAHTYSKADRYYVCNRLHSGAGSSYYYTYQEMHYVSSPVTKCLYRYGLHSSGFPSTSSYSWIGSTFAGHVSSNPC
jgi:hypothetical protein